MKGMKIAWIVGGLLAASLFTGVGLPLLAHAETKPATITVQGTGTVDTVPNTATMWFGVTTQAATASAALAANSATMTKVIAALKDAGVAAKDIRTEVVSIQPQTDEIGVGGGRTGGGVVSGYTATNSVSATVRELARIGAVIDAAVGAGADSVSGPSLTHDDVSALYRDALKKAFADAKAKAAALATASSHSLGPVQSITEGSGPVPVPLVGVAKDASTPIEPGTQQVQATVTVTFAAT
jgi:uncharacterized protein